MVKCWGDNEFGQLGNGTTTDSATPVEVDLSGSPTIDPSAKPTIGPKAVVQAFYDWYLTDHDYDLVFARPELTPEFVQFVKSFDGGYDPILCAQDSPTEVTATSEDISGSSATVETSVAFGGSPAAGQTVTLILGPTGWQISAIDCGF